MEPSSVQVAECPRCGQAHRVDVTPYRLSTRRQPFTHWYICPVTNDPASLNLTMEREIILDQRVIAALAEAQHAGQFMVAIWRVQDGQLYRPYWMTNNFPKGDLRVAVENLAHDLEKEMLDGLPPAALPRAEVQALQIVHAHEPSEPDDSGDIDDDAESDEAGACPEPEELSAAQAALLPHAIVATPPTDIRLDNDL